MFPRRDITSRRREGAAHWLVAYREAEEEKYRNLRGRIKESYKKCESELAKTSHRVTLDRAFLLQLHHVDKPSELCFLDISEQKLNSVKPEDLEVFDNVAFIDASINSLSLGSFSSFVSLRELNLSLNGVCNMTFDAADFPHLEVLDLSYNRLSPDAIVSLGRLPRLKILHLTANRLQRLPPNLGSSNQDPTQQPAKEEETYFRALEVLMLDDNKLSSGVFNSLRNLKRLKHLSLQANRISEIPFMQLVGYSKSRQIPTKEQAEEEAGEVHTQSEPTDQYLISEIFHRDNWERTCNKSSLPLPELQCLNLADNKIAKEEALLAATLFPVLREIDIQFNPVTTQRRGDPPLLAYLQERLGITIKQKKTHAVVKHPLKVSAELKWKVEENIPKLSRKLLRMNARTQAGRNEGKNSRSHAFHENRPFFLTQAADGPEFEFGLLSEHKEIAENKERNDANPEQRDRLMDAEPNPHVLKPSAGIQTAVRMLERTLKNLNVYRDPKPKLDSIQTPYRAREKRIKELPPLKPVKQPTERVDDMMKEIRESKAIKVVTLGSVLHSTGHNKEDYKEALSLMSDMKKTYKMVHTKTMKQEASIKSDRDTDQI